jgi:hypothetical protein
VSDANKSIAKTIIQTAPLLTGLIFNRLVPPTVHHKGMVASGEIDTGSCTKQLWVRGQSKFEVGSQRRYLKYQQTYRQHEASIE